MSNSNLVSVGVYVLKTTTVLDFANPCPNENPQKQFMFLTQTQTHIINMNHIERAHILKKVCVCVGVHSVI